MKQQLRSCACIALLLLAASNPAMADGRVVNKVYHPYVDALHYELEYRLLAQDEQSGKQNLAQLQQLSLGRSIGTRFFAEVYLVAAEHRSRGYELAAWETELKWQLTEQGEYAVDWGLLLEYEDELNSDAQELSFGLLAEKELGRFSGTANLLLVNEWGEHVSNERETTFATQIRYRHNPAFEPGLEFYAGQDYQGMGPVMQGSIRTGIRKSLHWELGSILGLDQDSPSNTWRVLLEYEF